MVLLTRISKQEKVEMLTRINRKVRKSMILRNRTWSSLLLLVSRISSEKRFQQLFNNATLLVSELEW